MKFKNKISPIPTPFHNIIHFSGFCKFCSNYFSFPVKNHSILTFLKSSHCTARYSCSLAKLNGIHGPWWEWPCLPAPSFGLPVLIILNSIVSWLSAALSWKTLLSLLSTFLQLEYSFPCYSATHPSTKSLSNSIFCNYGLLSP